MFPQSILTALALCAALVKAQSCDTDQSGTLRWTPTTPPVEHYPDDLVKMSGEGKGASAVYHRKTSHVACLKAGWVTETVLPGNGCKRWIRVENLNNGAKTDAQVLDTCEGDLTSFGCEDLFLSERAFEEVAGSSKGSSAAAGHLTDKMKWHYQVPPCWTCYAGKLGQLPNGKLDDCFGRDDDGFMRCGTKYDEDMITGKDVEKVCNKDYECPQ